MFDPFGEGAAVRPLPGDLRLIDGLKRASTLETRTPALPTGWDPLDRAIGGGLPGRKLTEIVAPLGGKASLLFALAATTTRSCRNLAWIDPASALDVDGAEAAGVVLDRVLWVRPATVVQAFRAADLVLGSDGFAIAVLDLVGAGDRLLLDATVWARLARRAEAGGVTLVVCTERPMAGGAASLRLDVRVAEPRWGGHAAVEPLTLEGAGIEVAVRHRKGGQAGFAGSFECRR